MFQIDPQVLLYNTSSPATPLLNDNREPFHYTLFWICKTSRPVTFTKVNLGQPLFFICEPTLVGRFQFLVVDIVVDRCVFERCLQQAKHETKRIRNELFGL